MDKNNNYKKIQFIQKILTPNLYPKASFPNTSSIGRCIVSYTSIGWFKCGCMKLKRSIVVSPTISGDRALLNAVIAILL